MANEITLFDLGVEDPNPPEKKEKPKGKGKGSSVANEAVKVGAKKEVKKPEPVFVTGDWTIHFATDRFTVEDFVDEIPEEGVTLEALREGMERHFPQFTAARTKWDVDKENKRLFPDAFAGSKGAIINDGFTPSFFLSTEEAFQSNVRKPYLLSGDGKIMEVVKSPIGTMVAEAQQLQIPVVEPGFQFALPKMPNQILRQIVGFFKAFLKEKANYEVALRVYWDSETASYVVECPKQHVTSVAIELQYSEQYIGRNSLRYIPVLEVHSHNVMRAFFSEVDNNDEQAYCIYGVFGRLNREQIDMMFRVKRGNTFVYVAAADIFELAFDQYDFSYPKDWDEKVTIVGGW